MKTKPIDACTHKETLAHMRTLRGHAAASAPPAAKPISTGIKKQLMDAASCAQKVAQVGIVKMTGGIALYAAHIRQMDQAARTQRAPSPRQMSRDKFGREHYD